MNPDKKMVALAGSETPRTGEHKAARNADPDEIIEVSVHLRSRNRDKGAFSRELAEVISRRRKPLSREEWAEKFGVHAEDCAHVERIAKENGFSIGARHDGARMIFLKAPSSTVEEFFGVKRQIFENSGGRHVGHEGEVHVPEEIAGIVEHVSGLGKRLAGAAHPQPQWIFVPPVVMTSAGFLPTEVAKVYDFPTSVNGAGQTIGVIELGGGILLDDLQKYCEWMKTPVPTFESVAVHGPGNDPTGKYSEFDGEVSGDIETIAGIAPGARIVGYFTDNSNDAFLDAVKYAIHDQTYKPSVLSVSWGDPESTWAPSTMQMFNQVLQEAAALGVTVCCASGDYGSSAGVKDGGLHVCFPGSSPYSLACGGTHLVVATGGNKIQQETVWNNSDGASGGGFSDQFPMPQWQLGTMVEQQAKRAGLTGRGVPDVASDGDPKTGYIIRVNGKFPVGAGTSAAAPVWAGLIALINQKLGHAAGFINPFLYGTFAKLQSEGAMRAITEGNNGAYSAGPGWNACTGVGTPDGTKLMDAFVARDGAKAASATGKS